MRGPELLQLRQQPADRQSRRADHPQLRRIRRNLLHFALHHRKGLCQHRVEPPPCRRQLHPAGIAVEQLHADVVLQDLYLAADRAPGHEQLVCGSDEALVAGGGLEGAQGIEGRQAHAFTMGQFS